MRDHSYPLDPAFDGPPRRLSAALVASSLRLGGAEKQTVYMARALVDAGVDTQLFYLGEGGRHEGTLREWGVPMRRIFQRNKPWKMLRRLIAALRVSQPDIVLANQFGDLRFGIPAGRLCRALTLGGVRSDGRRELKAHGLLGWIMIWMAHGFIANSQRAKTNLEGRGVRSSKVEVLPNAIDLRDFDAQSALGFQGAWPEGRVVAAAVGSLQPGKRFDRFLEALARARKTEPALAGVIAGEDCGCRAELEQRAAALNLGPEDIVFAGECDRVPALLAQSNFLVLSSDYEGFPNVVIEAMAARLPVISTAVGDAGAIVEHGRTGYVVECEDVAGMSAQMARLARSAPLRSALGAEGRHRVEREYGYDVLAGRLLGIFRTFAVRQGRTPLLDLIENVPGPRRDPPPLPVLVDEPAAQEG